MNLSILASGFTCFITKQTDSPFLHRAVAMAFLYMNDFLGIVLIVTLLRLIQKLQHCSLAEMKNGVIQGVFAFTKEHIPFVKKELKKEVEKMESSLKESMWKGRKRVTKVLPKDGLDMNAIVEVSNNICFNSELGEIRVVRWLSCSLYL